MSAPDPSAGLPEEAIPVLWLLGKTGAGKSSLVRALTGLDQAAIGEGFRPCTATAEVFDYPADAPLLRFLDTRGLGETGYDPTDDIAASEGRSHAVLAMMRLDDPVQGAVIDTVLAARKARPDLPVALVLTGADMLAPGPRDRAAHAMIGRVSTALGGPVPVVRMALPQDGQVEGMDPLIEALSEILPQAALLLAAGEASDAEAAAFEAVRQRVLFYAGLAAAGDFAPVVGAVSVPAAQAAMLAELARRHDLSWSRRVAASFAGSLGVGLAARYAALFGLRQIGKLIPVLGQTAVAAASSTVSFATTFALGRAASYWLHHRRAGSDVAPEDLRRIYRDALLRAAQGRDSGAV